MTKIPEWFLSLHLKAHEKETADSTNGKANTEANIALGTANTSTAPVTEKLKTRSLLLFTEDKKFRVLSQVPATIEYLNNFRK